MATGLQSWSKTAASNATADSNVNWAEGQSPGSINNSARAEMASAAMWRDDNAGTITTGGTSTAYTATSNQTLSLSDGVTITLQMSAANGATPTLNVDSTGAKPIQYKSGTAVPTAYLLANGVYRFVYRSSPDAWIVLGGLDAYTVGGTDVAITDGGTGASTSTAAFDALSPVTTRGDLIYRNASSNARLAIGAANTILKSDGTDPAWGNVVAANITDATITFAKLASAAVAAQSDMETTTSSTTIVTPSAVKYHPGVAKAYVKFDTSGNIQAQHNVSSITDNGAGDWTINFTTALSTANYVAVGSLLMATDGHRMVMFTNQGTTSIRAIAINASNDKSETNVSSVMVAIYGDFA